MSQSQQSLVIPVKSFSKSVRRRWYKFLRSQNISWNIIQEVVQGGGYFIITASGQFADMGDGRAISFTASGRPERFTYCRHAVAKGERRFPHTGWGW